MSDNEIDAELLALADDDSASEAENTKPTSRDSKSNSPLRSPPPTTTQKSEPSPAPKGVAKRKTLKSARSKRRQRDESDEEGEASSGVASPNSLGSGAMSESDSEGSAGGAAGDDSVLFPIDGIFRSEKEKADINSMPEIERERLLAERAEEAEKLAQSAQLRQIMQAREKAATAQKKRKAASTDMEESPRKSSRAKTKQSENLAAYKRQREQRNEERRRGDDRRAQDKRSPSQENGYSDAEGDAESDVEWDDGPSKASITRDEPPPTMRDYERVKVGRTNFARVCFYPGFDDAIKGCFVRVAIGINKATGQNTYRMTQIKGFVQGKPYLMEGPNGRPFHTDQYAILSHGKAEKEWPFIACSDSRITDSEFDRYNQTLAADGLRSPARSFLEAKCAAIQQLLDHRWTEEEISEKLRRAGAVQAAAATYDKERLEKQRKLAVANGNDTELARIDLELAALNGSKAATTSTSFVSNVSAAAKPASTTKAPTQQERLAAINRANRKANTEEIRKAQLEDKRRAEAQKQAILKGEGVANPFARVKTRAKVHHDANGNETLQVKKVDDLFGEGSDISRAATPTPGAAKNGVSTPKGSSTLKSEGSGLGVLKKKVMDDDVLGAMDLGIEIDI